MNEYIVLALLSLGTAAAYALLSSGLVLIYRASGVLNFAQGAFAMVAAFFFYELRVNHGWAYLPALIVTVLVTAAAGTGFYLLILRPLRDASSVVRVIATLGMLSVLTAAATLRYSGNVLFLPESLPKTPVHIGSVLVPQDRFWLMGIAIVLVIILHFFSTKTRFGLATLAVAENERSSAAYGWSPTVIAAVNWAIGTGLAGLAGVLVAPLGSLSVNSLVLLVVPALGVALFGQFSSFPLTLLGAVVVGVVQGLLTKYETNVPGLSDLVPLALIVIVLVVRRRALPGRGELIDRLPAIGTGAFRLTTVVPWFVAGILGALFLPAEWSSALGVSVVAGIIILSMVVVTGYAGQLSLGQYGLAGLGALTSAQLVSSHGWPFWAALIVGVLVAGLCGMLFGIPSLRSRGAALAIVTLSLGQAIASVVLGNEHLSGTDEGLQITNLTFLGIDLNPLTHARSYTIFCLCCFAVTVWVVSNIRRSDIGRQLIAVRTNERAAASLGINVGAAKLFAFSVSAAMAGFAGILLAFSSTSILISQAFTTMGSINSVLLSVVGGVGYVRGAVFGGQIVTGGLPGGVIANHLSSGDGEVWLTLIGGLLLLVTIRLNPNGIANSATLPIPQKWKAALRRQRSTARPLAAPASPPRTLAERAGELKLDGLSVRFGGVTALNGVDLSIRSGEIVGLIGPNGAGKTTLIDAVTGYVTATGEVRLDGASLSRKRPFDRARAGVTRGFQSLELFDDVTVEENLRAASDKRKLLTYPRGLIPSRRRPFTAAAYAAIVEFGLEEDLGKTPKELSYGRRKLVAIARSVATSPRFLLLDEPAAGLGEQETQELGRLIRRLADEWQIGVLLIEHDVDLVMSVSDRVAVLEFGHKIAEGPPSLVRADPKVIAAYLGVPESAEVAAHQGESGAGSLFVLEQPTTPISEVKEPSDGPLVVNAQALSAGYLVGPVVHDLDLKVRAGQVVALLGPNGAGKTTTVLTLAGALKPLSGTAGVMETPNGTALYRRARKGLAYLAEERSVFMRMTVEENLRVAGVDSADAFEFFPELKPLAKRRAGLLSGGEQQMLALGAVLARRPALVLADELSLGLAPLVVDRLLKAVRAAADNAGTGILLVEQHVTKALQYADYVYVLGRGRIVMEGTAAEMRSRAAELESAYVSSSHIGSTDPE